MIKAILFDLNGVFISGPKLSSIFEQKYNISNDIFITALKDVMSKVRLPNADDVYTYWKPYFDEWDLDISKKDLLNMWFPSEKEDASMINMANNIKSNGVKIFIVSNNFRERAEYYKEMHHFLENLFDKTYYSWKTGYVKPDEEVFKLVLRENDLEPEECIYFDDSETNVKVARSLGIKSYLFGSPDKTKEILFENKII